MAESNKYFHGKNGRLWINDQRYTNCYSLNVSIANNYEEITDPRDDRFGKVQIPNGWSGAGSLTIRRDGSELALINELAKATANNTVPEFFIIAKMQSNDKNKVSRYRYDDVTFDSYDLQKFEHATAITEMEIAFKFASFEEL